MLIPLSVVIAMNIISGTSNSLIASGMNKIAVAPGFGLPPETFADPFVQSFIMMIGQGFCLILFAAMYCRSQDVKEPSPWRWGQLLFAIPCCFDWGGSSMMFAALLDIPASQVQLMRGALVVFVFLLSIFVLRNRQYAHHYVGVCLVAVGIACIGWSAILLDDQKPENDKDDIRNPTRGVVLCLGAQFMGAMMMTSEEKIFRKLDTPPLLAVGVEGACGVLLGVVVLTATYFSGLDHPGESAYQIFHSSSLFGTSAALCICVAMFDYSGVTITKNTSATGRATIGALRSLLIWMIDLAFSWAPLHYWTFAFWLQPIGFFVTISGTLIYFNTLAIPALMGKEELIAYHEKQNHALKLDDENQRA
eukprot:GEMP01018157.1.p1 GENE.GEMP01018157.1~~GEMP01018157.1.p1  ORF type:complete len:363 (+),score=63.23 GEMP01018157.1:256-1344(+)